MTLSAKQDYTVKESPRADTCGLNFPCVMA